ncbi:MAG: CAP domain-containing protein [Patescibacteria group bacterium]|nr:CAP domain-containing protein [Patescibacteria group bacterium]
MILPARIIRDSVIPTYTNSFFPYLLRKPALVAYTLVVLVVNVMGGVVGTSVIASTVSASTLVMLANQERTAVGLSELKVNPQLVSAAYAKAENIFELQYWAHYGPNGESPWDFILGSGYDYVYAGENLAKGFNTSEGIHSAWIASKTHRENIMNSKYRDVGIAVVPGELNGVSVMLVVQMFGSLTQDVPAPSSETLSYLHALSESVSGVQIVNPENGDVLPDNRFKVSGNASSDIESIDLYDNEELLGGTICESGIWDYRPEQEWEEGRHVIRIEDGVRGVSDDIEVEVDTESPEILGDTVSIQEKSDNGTEIEFSVGVLGDPEDVVITIGEYSEILSSEGDKFSADLNIPMYSDGTQAQIIATDVAGNYSVYDISDEILGATSLLNGDDQSFFGRLNLDTSLNVFNRVGILAIGILLVIDAIYLFKMNILTTRGKTLFPFALWIIMMCVALVGGTRGVIS